MSVAGPRLALVRETMFQIAARAEEKEGENRMVSPEAHSLAHRPEAGR
jgi:hypothetical protein